MTLTISHLVRKYIKDTRAIGAKAALLIWVMWIPMAKAQVAPPVVINLETQLPVELIRAYWNANVDIAKKTIACDHFQYSVESAVYERLGGFGEPTFGLFLSDGFQYIHTPLGRDAEGTVRSSFVLSGILDQRISFWNVRDGIYTGIAPFDSHEYIELGSYDATTRQFNVTANNNAFRVWHSLDLVSPATYSACYDVDGTALIPTGSASIGNTNLINLVEVDFTFQFPQPLSGDVDVPVIIRRDTGEQVEFVRGEWRYNETFAGNSMGCEIRDWDGQEYFRVPDSGFTKVFYPFVGGTAVTASTRQDDSTFPRTRDELVEEFLPVFRDAQYMELVGSGFNLWSSGVDFSHISCTSRPPHLVLPLQPDNCDYTVADQYDGWGWNAATQQGCPPRDDLDNAMDGESTGEQLSDSSMSSVESDDVDNNTSGDNDANGTVEQPNNGNNVQVETDIPETVLETTGNDSTSTDNTEDQSNDVDITSVQTSGSGAADKFLLLFLICFFARRSTWLENRTK